MKLSLMQTDSFVLILSIIALLLISNILLNYNNNHYFYIHHLGKNWSMNTIYNAVSQTNETQYCRSMINDRWPGTVGGCFCEESFLGAVNRDYCLYEPTCKDISGIKPVPYKIWRKTSLCSEKLNSSYFDYDIVSNEEVCPYGKKPCGIIDTMNNIICVRENLNCPIHSLQVIEKPDIVKQTENNNNQNSKDSKDLNTMMEAINKENNFSDDLNTNINMNLKDLNNNISKNTTNLLNSMNSYSGEVENNNYPNILPNLNPTYPLNKNFSYINLSDNKILLYSQSESQKGRIPVQFKISDSIPCKDPYYKNLQHSLYELDFYLNRKQCKDIHGKFYDSSYYVLDSYDYLYVINDNYILDDLQQLPNFDLQTLQYDINLYYKSYVGVNSKCFKDLKQQMTKKALKDMINLKEKTELVLFYIGICFMFSIITVCIFSISVFVTCFVDNLVSRYVISIVPIVMGLFHIILEFTLNNLNENYFEKIDILQDPECLDETTALVFYDYYSNVTSTGFKLIIYTIIIILLFFYPCYAFGVKYQELKEFEIQQNRERREIAVTNEEEHDLLGEPLITNNNSSNRNIDNSSNNSRQRKESVSYLDDIAEGKKLVLEKYKSKQVQKLIEEDLERKRLATLENSNTFENNNMQENNNNIENIIENQEKEYNTSNNNSKNQIEDDDKDRKSSKEGSHANANN